MTNRTPDLEDAPGGEALDLISTLTQASSDQLAFTTNALIDSLTDRAEVAERTLDAVRGRIETLLAGPWQPSSAAILRALYPRVSDLPERQVEA